MFSKINEKDTNERKRLIGIILGTLTSGISKAVALLIIAVSISWVSNYLNPEQFGLWISISTIIGLVGLVDFGINNSIVNSASEAIDSKKKNKLKNDISNSFIIVSSIALIIGLILLAIFPFIKWTSIFGITNQILSKEIPSIIAVTIIIFLLTLPFSLASRVQIGIQESWRANIWQATGGIASIAAIYFSIEYNLGIIGVILASLGVPLFFIILNFIDFFFLRRPDLKPSVTSFNTNTINRLIKVSLVFFSLQVLSILGQGVDNILISYILGSSAVGAYAVTQKLTLALGFAQLLITPLWPAIGDALARDEITWAKKIITKALLLSVLVGITASLILITIGEQIVYYWTNNTMKPTEFTIYGFAIHSILMGVGGCIAAYTNNTKYLKKQLIYYFIATAVALFLKVIFLRNFNDPSGAIWSNIIGYGIFFVIPTLLIIYNTSDIQKAAPH